MGIPLVILAGSDRGPHRLPPRGSRLHALTGHKSLDIQLDGRSLLSHVLDRYRACSEFDPVVLAGPEVVYRPVAGSIPLIPTEGSVGQNVRIALETVRASHAGPIAVSSCDILPELAELQAALTDYHRDDGPAIWFPMIRMPSRREELGASFWKPSYRIVPEGEAEAVPFLPGHLAIIRPEALRLKFIYRILDAAYASRNRSLRTRRGVFLRRLVVGLLLQDLRRLLTFHSPTLTHSVLRHGLHVVRKLREKGISQRDLEECAAGIGVRSAFRKGHPGPAVRVPLLTTLSLACDIDTEEEANQLVRERAAEALRREESP